MRRTGILLILIVAVALFGCKTTGGAGGGADMDVSFQFTPAHKCSDISPKIMVSQVPQGTKEFKVSLKDLNVPTWNHGGGTAPYTGDGVIPQGALTKGYNGPCPPSGSHVYQFTVTALDGNGNVLGKGKAKQRFP